MDWLIDLDGVMWRGRRPIPGSAEAVARILRSGSRVVFCTNNSAQSGAARAEGLVAQGVPSGCEVITSADAVCALVAPGERVLVLGGPGLVGALDDHGATAVPADGDVDPRGFDAVVVGLTRDFSYGLLDVTSAAVRHGARLLASNTDATFPGPDGMHPGCGSIVAAVEIASGATATSAGKPLQPMADLVVERLGSAPAFVAGDRPDTDGRLAERLGWPFVLVLSGVTAPEDLPAEVSVHHVADDLAAAVAALAPPGRR